MKKRISNLIGLLGPLALALPAVATELQGFSAGVDLRAQVQAAELGLPEYPGAKLRKPQPESASGERGAKGNVNLSFNAWGGAYGVRLLTLGYGSGDSVERVATFYREALARLGPVLDCSAGTARPPAGTDKTLGCDKDSPDPRHRLYKVGTPERQRIVVVQPADGGGAGAQFQLTLVELRKP